MLRIALASLGLLDPTQISLADCLTLGLSKLFPMGGVDQLCSVGNDRLMVVAHENYIAAFCRV